MKTANIILTIVFLIFALLQYNDPDPYVWIPIYLLAAYLCWQATKNKYPGLLYFIGIIICLIYGSYLFFDKNGVLSWANEHAAESLVHTMKADKPWIEESREFGGLLVVLLVLLVNYFLPVKTKTGKNLPVSE